MHTIALKGPWEITSVSHCSFEKSHLGDTNRKPPSSDLVSSLLGRTLKPPVNLAAVTPFEFGAITFSRWFNKPTGLTPDLTISVVLVPPFLQGAILMDDHHLLSWPENSPPLRAPITRPLQSRMQLRLVVGVPKLSAPDTLVLPDTVRLEIS